MKDIEKTLNDKIPEITDRSQVILTLFLYLERMNTENSSWKYFLESLPQGFDTYPFFYSEKHKEMTKYSLIEYKVKRWKEQLEDEFKLLKITFPFLDNFEEFSKCAHLVWSRNFRIDGHNLMVPVCDMFNNDPDYINVNYEFLKEENIFKIYADKDIKKGEEVFIFYD
jgi:hypothetical protein